MKNLYRPILQKLSFLSFIIVVILSSCQKENIQYTKQAASEQVLIPQPAFARYAADDAANPANPYDSIGLVHNESVHGTRSAWTNKHSTFTDIYNSTVSYVTTNYDSSLVPPRETESYAIWTAVDNDAPNWEANVVSATSLSANGQAYANKIIELSLQPDSTYTYDDLKKSIVDVERTFASDPSLTTQDINELYKVASIARYSTLYWINEAGGANSGSSLLTTVRYPTTPVAAQAAKFNWIAAAIADIGAIIHEIGSHHGFWHSVLNVIVASAQAGSKP